MLQRQVTINTCALSHFQILHCTYTVNSTRFSCVSVFLLGTFSFPFTSPYSHLPSMVHTPIHLLPSLNGCSTDTWFAFFRLIAKWRSLDGNLGVLRIVIGCTSTVVVLDLITEGEGRGVGDGTFEGFLLGSVICTGNFVANFNSTLIVNSNGIYHLVGNDNNSTWVAH